MGYLRIFCPDDFSIVFGLGILLYAPQNQVGALGGVVAA